MRRLFLCLVLALVATAVLGKNKNLTYTDDITAADTVIASKRVDTTYTSWQNIEGATRIQYYAKIINDTNWVNDTFFVLVQFSSHTRNPIKTYSLDTFLTTDSGLAVFDVVAADSFVGSYMRGMLIHWDSLELSGVDLFENSYETKFDLWFNPIY